MIVRSVVLAAASLAATGVAMADEAALATIAAACRTDMDIPPGTCSCVAGRAGTDLDERQQAWLAASMTKQFNDALALKDQMTPDQAVEAAMFLVIGAQACTR